MAFLAAQPDVMVVGSGIRYFAEVPYPPETLARIRETRAVRLWRDQMLDQFCAGQWAVVVDPDEFLALPADLPAFIRVARRRRRRGGLGGHGRHVPANGCATSSGRDAARFRLEDAWFFDAQPHLDPRQARETPPVPRTVYPGSVARLFATWGVLPQGTLVRRIRRRLSGYRYQARQPDPQDPGRPLAPGRLVPELPRDRASRSPPGSSRSCTSSSPPTSGARSSMRSRTGGYNQASRSYRLYATLIERMRARDGAFVAGVSRRYRDPRDFADAGIAR